MRFLVQTRLIEWSEREKIKKLLDSRDYMMGNKNDRLGNTFYDVLICDQLYFSKSLIFGFFIDDELDCVAHHQPWTDLPGIYSITFVATMKRPNREKFPNGYDKNHTIFQNQRYKMMEDLKFYVGYTQHNAETNWQPFHSNEYSRIYTHYDIDVVEKIPAGTRSKYNLFQKNYLGCNPHPMDTVISCYFLPTAKRNNYEPTFDI